MAAADAAATAAAAAGHTGRKRRRGGGGGGGGARPERACDEVAPDSQVGRRAYEARGEPGQRARQQLPVDPLPGCRLRRPPQASQVRGRARRNLSFAAFVFIPLAISFRVATV